MAMACEAGKGPGAGAGGHDEGRVIQQKSLCKVLFGADITVKSEEEMIKGMKNAIQLRALTLRDEIIMEMNLKEEEEALRKAIQELTLNRNLLASLQNEAKEVKLKGTADMYKYFMNKNKITQETVKGHVLQTMKRVNMIEQRIKNLKMCWDHFIQNYPVGVGHSLAEHINKQRNEPDRIREVEWADFLPKFMSTIQKGSNKTVQHMNYFVI